MGRKKAVDKAKRAWWDVHVQAQRASGLNGASYCRKQGLNYDTFRMWKRAIEDWEAQKSEHRRQWKRRYQPISQDKRRQATQAFWAMHVEAWTWSGLTLREYSGTHRLSPFSLKRWRNIVESAEFEIDWRRMLHPSSLPLISNKISTRTKEEPARLDLTNAIDPTVREQARRIAEGIEEASPPREKRRRRRFTTEQKIAILLEVERHGESMSSISRAYGLSTSLLFRWREKFGLGHEKPTVLVPVTMIEDHDARAGTPSLLTDLMPCPPGMAVVELEDGRRVFAPAGIDPEAVRREVAEREGRKC